MCSICTTAFEGIIQGVASGIAWLLLATVFTYARDAYIRCKLRKAFSYIGANREHHGFGVTIHNRSTFDIIVKDVTLFDKGNTGIRLLFAEEQLGLTVSEKPFKDPRQFVLYSARLPDAYLPSWQLAAIPLSAHSEGVWIAPAVLFDNHPDFKPVRCHFAIQYQNLLGTPRLIVIDTKSPANTDVSEEFEKYLDEKRAGKLGKSVLHAPPNFVMVTTTESLNQNNAL